MARLLVAAALLAAAFYAYGEYTGPGGLGIGGGYRSSVARSGGETGFGGARSRVIGGVKGAAGASN